jgi:outer membrane lipoprotein carrier protein
MTRVITLLCLTLMSTWSWAETDGTDALIALLGRIDSVQGQFLQHQYDGNEVLLSESSGDFRLLRPGYFAWEIISPDSQLIIADPTYIWHHDLDLETVTRRPVAESEQMSPLQVLGGNEELLRSGYTVSQATANTFSLHPKNENAGFQRLLVSFRGDVFEGLEIADNLNQRIVIEFEKVDTETKLTPEDFAFTPPDGADLFYYDQ